MANFELVSVDVMDLTSKIAEEVRDLMPSEGERSITKSRVEYLRKQYDEGMVTPFRWVVVDVEDKGKRKRYRANGHHSSSMIAGPSSEDSVLNGYTPPSEIEGKVILETYLAEDIRGVVELFKTQDSRQSARSRSDVIGAFSKIYPELRMVPVSCLSPLLAGRAWYGKNVDGTPVPPADEVELMLDSAADRAFYQWGSEFKTGQSLPQALRVQGFAASVYAMYSLNPGDAREFLSAVFDGGDEHDDSAATVLAVKIGQQLEETDKRNKWKPGQWYHVGVMGWNAYRKRTSNPRISAKYSDYATAM